MVKEKKGFSRKMMAEEINLLPLGGYAGEIVVVNKKDELEAVFVELDGETVLGFDTETRPSFHKGEDHKPALIQLASSKKVYIFQLRRIFFPAKLKKILENPDIVKAGVALEYDICKLKNLRPFQEASMVELSKAAAQAGIQNHGLRGLAAILLGIRISKGASTSNWAAHNLTPAQIRYAATDAWVGREIYLYMAAGGLL
ncbi:MAG: hypothetical protein A2511_11175 [Deltaproteobacteria bacterium RIFOXYD12_FULL_50_9]|nr:MAG: hypothetical protein A2511_11175 [Deltaproteobacteria bacterium RIFOXYD12_FULL_50_9]